MLSQVMHHPAMGSGSLWPSGARGEDVLVLRGDFGAAGLSHSHLLRGLSQPICKLLLSSGPQAQGQKDEDRAEDHTAHLWPDMGCVTMHFCLPGRSTQRNCTSLPPGAS